MNKEVSVRPPAPEPTPADRRGFGRVVMVQDGDTVERLARRIYGLSDEKTIERIQKSNPELRDINLIFPGQILFFPVLEAPG